MRYWHCRLPSCVPLGRVLTRSGPLAPPGAYHKARQVSPQEIAGGHTSVALCARHPFPHLSVKPSSLPLGQTLPRPHPKRWAQDPSQTNQSLPRHSQALKWEVPFACCGVTGGQGTVTTAVTVAVPLPLAAHCSRRDRGTLHRRTRFTQGGEPMGEPGGCLSRARAQLPASRPGCRGRPSAFFAEARVGCGPALGVWWPQHKL